MDYCLGAAMSAIVERDIDVVTGEVPAMIGGRIKNIIMDSVRLARVVDPFRKAFPEAIPELWSKLNGVVVKFEADSDPELLYRDFRRAMNGFISGPVGPYPSLELSPEELESDARKLEEMEKAEKLRAEEWRKKAEEEKRRLDALLERCPQMEISDEEAWRLTQDANQDDYGGYVCRYAENWARLMQKSISSGATVAECAEELSHVADVEGLTGYQYGLAVSLLSMCWVHGEELRRWHNKETQIGTEGDRANEEGGTLNPALLCLS